MILPGRRRPLSPEIQGQLTANLESHLADSLKTLWRRYRKRLKTCRKEFSEEAVHELRVETRRLLALMALLESILPAEPLKKTRRTFRKRLDAFACLRDTQVQLLSVEKLKARFPGARQFHRALARQERRLTARARRKVKHSRLGKLAKRIKALKRQMRQWSDAPAARKELAAKVAAAVQDAFARTSRLRQRMDAAHTLTIHRTRVAFKHFRYVVETLQPILPGVTAKQIRNMHAYQAMMGEVQDMEVLLATLRRFAAKGRINPRHVPPLRRELNARRAALIRSCLASADQLYGFWPPRPRRRSPGPSNLLKPHHDSLPLASRIGRQARARLSP